LDRSGLVEGGVGSAITYVMAVVADHGKRGGVVGCRLEDRSFLCC